MKDKALELTEKAFNRGELDKLLTGEGEYSYTPKFSLATDTDMALLLPSGIYKFQRTNEASNFALLLESVLRELVSRYGGLYPVAAFILIESYGRSTGDSPFSFPLEPIASSLKESILSFQYCLKEDRSGYGKAWDDGLYGELRNLARNTVEYRGPDFFGL